MTAKIIRIIEKVCKYATKKHGFSHKNHERYVQLGIICIFAFVLLNEQPDDNEFELNQGGQMAKFLGVQVDDLLRLAVFLSHSKRELDI